MNLPIPSLHRPPQLGNVSCLTSNWSRNQGLHARRMKMAHLATAALLREDPSLKYRPTFAACLRELWIQMPCKFLSDFHQL